MARKVESRKFKLSKDIELNETLILKLINKHSTEKARVEKMLDYYDGRNDVKDRVYKKENRPSNRISNPTASYLCNMLVGYTFGKGISYKSENEQLLEAINDVFKYNDVADLDQALADNASICGYAYEMQYIDENAIPRMCVVPSEEMLVVYDTTLEENIIYAIRYWEEEDLLSDTGDKILYVELYDKDSVRYYRGDKYSIKFVEEIMHLYGDVPVTVYPLNNALFGAFEKVKDNIDQYDQVKSDIANIMESNASKAILVVSGIAMDDEEDDGSGALEADVINFEDPSATASFLTKNIDTTAVEAYLDRLMNDIHTLSQIPPLDSDGFVASSSGESLKWKCLGLEILASNFEAKFRKGIARRIELLCNVLSIMHNVDYDFTEVEAVFTRNTPANTTEMANIVKSLHGILSDETLFSLLPFVSDVQAELSRIESSQEDSLDVDYSFLQEGLEDEELVGEDNDEEEI